MRKFLILFTILLSFLLIGCQKQEKKDGTKEMVLQVEDQHFKYYSFDKDIQGVEDVKAAIDANFERITTNYDCELERKINVYIYPDIKSFHEAVGRPTAPDSIVGVAGIGTIKMVTPYNPGSVHDYDSIIKVAVHEFTHIVTSNKSDQFNPLFTEGIAMFEAGQQNTSQRDFIKRRVQDDDLPTLNKLYISFEQVYGAYNYAYTLIEFIVNEFGYSKLNQYLLSGSYHEAFGKTEAELETLWRAYLSEHYQ